MSHRNHPNFSKTPPTLPQKKGVSINEENGHYFTLGDTFRQKLDALVRELSGKLTLKTECNKNVMPQKNREGNEMGRDAEEKNLRWEGMQKKM